VDNTLATTYTFSGGANPNLGIGGTGRLTKQGAGVLVLSSSNTYSGPTIIAAGTLRLGTNNVLPNGAGFGNVTNNGTLDLNGFTDTIMGLDGTGIVDNSSTSNAALVIGGNNASGSYSGVIQDTGALTLQKNGSGTNFLLSASPTWGGRAFINAGTLAIGNDGALGAALVIVGGGGELATAGPRTIANAITTTNTGEGDFNTDAGDLILTGPINWVGPADMNKRGLNTMTLGPTVTATLSDTAEMAVFGGALIIDGSTIVITNDGLRTRATTNFTAVTLTIQNNASITLLGEANLSLGSSATITNPAVVPANLSNTVTLASGTVSLANGGIFVGSASGNVGVFNHNGGNITFSVLTNADGLVLANSTNSTGTYNLNGGTLTTSRVRQAATNDTTGTFVFGGGTLRALGGGFGTNFMSGLTAALVQAPSAFIDTDAFDIDIAQPLLEDPVSPNGGLVKNGSGSLALNGANTFSGTITVNAGLLRGRGSVVGNITGAGKIGGGDIDELGTLTVNGTSVAVTGGATLRVSHVGAVLSNDKVSAPAGVITHAGQLTLIPVGVDFAVGDQFDLFDAATINGSFTSYNLGLLPPGLSWDTTDVATTGIVRIVRTTQVQTITTTGNVNTITLSGVGPAASTGYRVLSTTNMALPVNLWSVYTNGAFDVNSNFSSVITVNSNDTRRFFIIINP
jgi:autotransporter-associated beta strand protein